METKQRMHLILGGLPRPEAQFTLYDADGFPFAVLDHAYEKWKVGPEWDGEPHSERWRSDNERSERIRELGWWHRRFTSVSINSGWQAMVDAVGRALVDRGWSPT
jgi:very-short-patch-repair endonuclease